MPRLFNRLSELKISQTKPDPAKNIILPDGGGLRLVITPAGHRHFEFKSGAGGVERTARLGRWPDFTLKAARDEAGRLRLLVKGRTNPVAARKLERLRALVQSQMTFEKVADDLLAVKQKNTSETYWKRMRSAIKANLCRPLGSLPIQDVDAPVLRSALVRLEARGALDMLNDVRRWASEIFDFAKANGQFVGDNPADALQRNVFQKHEGENMRALAWGDVPVFWRALDGLKSSPAAVIAARLLVLSACRPGEVRGARWEEFDFEGARWTIPASRMKMKKPHAVPLSRQVLGWLDQLRVHSGHSEYLFPSRLRGTKSKTISDMGLLKLVKKASGKDVHAHGFRALFSTHVAESGLWSDSVKEAALAHGKRGIEGVYDRATHYAERVKLMQWWADQIDSACMTSDNK